MLMIKGALSGQPSRYSNSIATYPSDILAHLDSNAEKPIHQYGMEAFKNEILNDAEIADALQGMMLSIVSSERANEAVEW